MNDPVKSALLKCGTDKILSVRNLIIGSGIGGSIAAEYLSRAGEEVLILEEGPDISEITPPVNLNKCTQSMWREGGIVPIESNARFVFAEGRTVGGGSMVNAGILHRLPEAVRADWESKYKITDFKDEDLSPFFNQCEKICAFPLNSIKPFPQAEYFKKGAEAKNWETVSPNTTIETKADGASKRKSMRATYLAEAVRTGTKILSRCRVIKINFAHGKAIGISAEHSHADGTAHKLDIECQNLVLACGAIQTPLLLLRSNIKKNIGNTLRFHPTLRITASFQQKTTPWTELMPSHQIKSLAPDLSFGMSLSWPAHLATSLMPSWPASAPWLRKLDSLAMYYVMTPSHGTGFVRPFGKSYRVGYKLTGEDLGQLKKGFRHLSSLLREAGATRLFPSLRNHDPGAESFEARDLFALSIHAFSSCPMGEAEKCPVNSYGYLKGFKNIRVLDASILPSAPTVNPQLSIMAIVARCLARQN